MSAECSQKKFGILIENKINKLELKKLTKIFKETLPISFTIKLKEKNNVKLEECIRVKINLDNYRKDIAKKNGIVVSGIRL